MLQNSVQTLKVTLPDGSKHDYSLKGDVLVLSPIFWAIIALPLVLSCCAGCAFYFRWMLRSHRLTYGQFTHWTHAAAVLTVDLLFVLLLLFISGVPLLVRQPNYFLDQNQLLPYVGAWLGVLTLWLVIVHQRNKDQPRVHLWPGKTTFGRSFLNPASSLLLCLVGFYLPMIQNYWVGLDEPYALLTKNTIWFRFYDDYASRPLATLTTTIALNLTPNHLIGILWMTAAVHLLTALLVFGIVRMLIANSFGPALIAAILFIISPAEQWRFAAILLLPYHSLVFFIALAIWLYLLSYRYPIPAHSYA